MDQQLPHLSGSKQLVCVNAFNSHMLCVVWQSNVNFGPTIIYLVYQHVAGSIFSDGEVMMSSDGDDIAQMLSSNYGPHCLCKSAKWCIESKQLEFSINKRKVMFVPRKKPSC